MSDQHSRDSKIAVAMTYLQNGLIDHDPDAVLLSPGARRINNGVLACPDPESLRRIILREPVAAIHNLRWVVDGDDAVVVYDMLVDWTRSEQSESFADPSTWRLAYIGERFHVVDGLIEEIEVVYAADAERSAPLERPARTPPAGGRRARARRRDRGVPDLHRCAVLAATAARCCSLLTRGASRTGATWATAAPRSSRCSRRCSGEGPKVVTGMDDLRWYVEGEEAVAFYTLDIDPTALGQADAEPVRMAIVERFRVHDGLITEVEPVIPGWIE